MNVLFIDTHKDEMTVILKSSEKETRISRTSDRSHSEIVMPAVVELFDKAKMKVEDLNLIVVVVGPGSFTGTRIGVTIAKTIAYTKEIPIKSITSLEMCGVSAEENADLVTVTDSKGVYSARIDGGRYVDMLYRKNSAFEEYVKDNDFTIIKDCKIDLDKILNYLDGKEAENPHMVNPIYIKEIDALK